MKIEGDSIIFNSGKEIYANQGIIGISPDGEITEGYDGNFSTDKLTSEEKLELADYMIESWQNYKRSYQ